MGLGGVGKTQVALELAYTVKERWPKYSIFWVPAVSGESFEQAYRKLASDYSITLSPIEENPKESVRRYFVEEGAWRVGLFLGRRCKASARCSPSWHAMASYYIYGIRGRCNPK